MQFTEHRIFKYRVKDAIKGKIAEAIFEHLFKDAQYTVLFMGYEKNLSYLVQTHKVFKSDPKIRVFGKVPDFLLIGRGNYYFVEVKYRTVLNQQELLRCATDLAQYYPHSRIFLVLPTFPFFYYNAVETIVENYGSIAEFRYAEVGVGRAEYYAAQMLARSYFERG